MFYVNCKMFKYILTKISNGIPTKARTIFQMLSLLQKHNNTVTMLLRHLLSRNGRHTPL